MKSATRTSASCIQTDCPFACGCREEICTFRGPTRRLLAMPKRANLSQHERHSSSMQQKSSDGTSRLPVTWGYFVKPPFRALRSSLCPDCQGKPPSSDGVPPRFIGSLSCPAPPHLSAALSLQASRRCAQPTPFRSGDLFGVFAHEVQQQQRRMTRMIDEINWQWDHIPSSMQLKGQPKRGQRSKQGVLPAIPPNGQKFSPFDEWIFEHCVF